MNLSGDMRTLSKIHVFSFFHVSYLITSLEWTPKFAVRQHLLQQFSNRLHNRHLKIITSSKSYRCWQFYFRQLRIEQLSFFFCVERGCVGSTHESRLFLSSGFKYSPTHHYCCHSQTYSDLLTPPVQKRLEADTLTPSVFQPAQQTEAETHLHFFFFWVLISVQPDRYHLSHLSDFV